MKKLILTLIVLMPGFAFAQRTLRVHESGGNTLTFLFTEIDSVTFNTSVNPPEMLVHSNVSGMQTILTSAIDSITYGFQSSYTCNPVDVFNSALTYGSISDVDGNTYRTIVIGTQEWMAENLRTSHYSNGDLIPEVQGSGTWIALNTGASVWLNNDSITYHCNYGKMYNWYAVNDGRKVCPVGWHVPTQAEWTDLINYLGGLSVAGGPMKSVGTTYWNSPNGGATNSSGLSLLPGSSRSGLSGNYSPPGSGSVWWSDTDAGAGEAYYRGVNFSNTQVVDNSFPKETGMYVRCVKD